MFTYTPNLHDLAATEQDAGFVRELKMLMLSNQIDFPSEDAKNALYNTGNQYGRGGQPRQALLCYLLAIDAALMGGADSSSMNMTFDSTGMSARDTVRGDLGSEFKNGGSAARQVGAFRLASHLYERGEQSGRPELAVLRAYVQLMAGERNSARQTADAYRSAHGSAKWDGEVATLLARPPSDMTQALSSALSGL